MVNRLSNLEPLIPDRSALGERAELSMARSEVRRGEHGGEKLPETLMGLHTVQGRHALRETVDRPTIIALGLVGDAEVQVRP
jgi:hypothetical protein